NGIVDSCELAQDPALDCDGNRSLDKVELAPRFALSQEEYPVAKEPQSVALADLDGDGDLDMAVGGHGSKDVTILAHGGDGTYGLARRIAFQAAVDVVEPLDANHDGKIDLIAVSWDKLCDTHQSWLSVMSNDGELKFTKRASYPVESLALSIHD